MPILQLGEKKVDNFDYVLNKVLPDIPNVLATVVKFSIFYIAKKCKKIFLPS